MKASNLINSINQVLNEDAYSKYTAKQLLVKLGKERFSKYVESCMYASIRRHDFSFLKDGKTYSNSYYWLIISSKLPKHKLLCNFYLYDISPETGLSLIMDVTDLYGGLEKRFLSQTLNWNDKNVSKQIDDYIVLIKSRKNLKAFAKSLGAEL